MSTITVGTIQSNTTSPPVVENSAGTQIGTFCRAWVNFNGTGTVAIRASFNVSSITDGGVGIYTVNFTTAMIDADYSFCGVARATAGNPYVVGISSTAQTTSALPIATVQNPTTGTVAIDSIVACVSVFR